jgi:hypothetical protein
MVSESGLSEAGESLAAPAYTGRTREDVTTAMAQFDDRRDAFEKKFAHDEELRFKATARRNKLLGHWVATRLGKTGAEADEYAKSVVIADFEEAGDGDVIRKVRTDLEAAGHAASEAEIRAKLDDLMSVAVTEIQAGR